MFIAEKGLVIYQRFDLGKQYVVAGTNCIVQTLTGKLYPQQVWPSRVTLWPKMHALLTVRRQQTNRSHRTRHISVRRPFGARCATTGTSSTANHS